MTLNHYVTLGRSGLRVSPLCLGTMTFGMEWGWGSDVETSERVMGEYLSMGGNFLDTANMYTKGHSEKVIGDYFAKTPGRRDRVVIATKFFGGMHVGDPNSGGAGRKGMHAALHESLRRLRTDYVDLYWMHCWDRFTPIEETVRALDDLVRAGKVRYVGFSDTPAWVCARAQEMARGNGWVGVSALQIEYSLLERTVEGELMPMAREYGMGVTPWSPLKGGVLTGKYGRKTTAQEISRGEWLAKHLNEKTFGVLDALESVAQEQGLERKQSARVALAWLLKKPGVTSPIFGARTVEQLRENAAALEVRLTEEQVGRLDEASRPQLNFPFDFVERSGQFMHGGSRINGEDAEVWPMAPQNDAERY